MVAKPRPHTDTVTALGAVEEKPYAYDFFAVMRYIECLHADAPRLGEAARPADEPIRLTQEPSLAFAPATLASFTAGDGSRPHRLSAYFLGLFGPHGPLPLHLTEFARDREHNFEDAAFRRFADLFHHRLMLLFYRAWANANPAASLDRPAPRRFDAYVGSTFGLGMPALRNRDAVPDEAKLYLAGLLGLGTRPAQALVAILREYVELPFGLRQFAGAWMGLARQDRSRLGARSAASTLGGDIVLGGSVWACQHRFQLICGPVGFEDFKRLLPGRDTLARLRDLVRNFVGDELEWDLSLVLFAAEVPKLQLGVSGELGWTSWLGGRGSEADADDVVITPSAANVTNVTSGTVITGG